MTCRPRPFGAALPASLLIPILLAGSVAMTSCSSRPVRSSSEPSRAGGGAVAQAAIPQKRPAVANSAREEQAFREITELYNRADYEGALRKADLFRQSFPRSAVLPQVENIAGLCHLLSKRPAEAIARFKAAITNNPKAQTFNQYVLYNLAKAQHEAQQAEAAEQTLALINPQVLDKDNRIKFHYLKANVFLKRSLAFEAARETLLASRLADPQLADPMTAKELRPGFVATLDQAFQQMPGTAQLQDLYKEFEDTTLADLLLLRLAEREKASGDLTQSEIHVQTLMARFPQSEYFPQASALSRAQEPEAPTDPAAVGVLLPTKGKFGKFGSRMLQAIQLAFNIYDESKPDSKVTLVVEDSGDEPEQAVRALDRLVKKHHVVAVVGPLLAKGLDQVTQRAQELRVPMLSLARQNGNAGEYVIPSGLTVQLQAQELARHAIQKMKLKRFAILSPRDRVGEDFMQHFWDAVESQGGEITGVESYNPGETDFRQPVDKLSGLYYTEARQDELDELAKLRETNQIKKRTRKTEQFFSLKPVVDYDAVFVPDEPKVAGQVLPTFAYRDVDKVTFLGPSAWNSPEFQARVSGNVAENAVFVDAFLSETPTPAAKRFIESFRTAFGSEPGTLDALAFDAAKVLAASLSGDALSRGELLARLKSGNKQSGATGVISFKDNQLYRELKVLTVKSGKIVEAK